MDKKVWLQRAKDAGISSFEIYEQFHKSTSIQIFDKKVENFKISECKGIALRGEYKGHMGICFLEDDNDAQLDYVLQQIKQNAQAITSSDVVNILGQQDVYPTIELTKNRFKELPTEEKISFLRNIEEAFLNYDARITQVMGVYYKEMQGHSAIQNSKGSDLSFGRDLSIISVSIKVSVDNDVKVHSDWICLYNLDDFDQDKFIADVGSKAIAKLGATQMASGTYPVIIDKNAMSDMLATLVGIFNGENAYKEISILKGQLHNQIFNEKITIVDDPLLKDGLSSAPFDDEGCACYCKTVVEQGILKTYLHNSKSASLMHTTSTGNGFKNGYASSVSILPTNFYIENGTTSFEDMVKMIKKGAIICEVSGLHAGINPISTEFSLQASGFYVEDGKIVKPINLVTVAGNFMDAMKHITCVGNDGKLNALSIGSPSILFEQLAISGE